MRRFAAALLTATATSALLAAPALARPRENPHERAVATDIAEAMSDPAVQDRVADAVGEMSDAMLDISLAPFARVLDAMGEHEAAGEMGRDTTLRDVAGSDAKRMPREMARRVPAMMGAMGGMAIAMERMLPELARVGEQMRDAAERAERGTHRARERTRDWDY